MKVKAVIIVKAEVPDGEWEEMRQDLVDAARELVRDDDQTTSAVIKVSKWEGNRWSEPLVAEAKK